MTMDKFPYETGDRKIKIIGKPKEYKGWTIWHYKIWCQQTGSRRGEWRDMTLAVKGGRTTLHGGVYQAIDALPAE